MSEAPPNRADRIFAEVDAMPMDLRACVHEYGYAIVNACRQAGVTAPNRIHQLVHEIWAGARCSAQHRQPSDALDWLLLQAGAQITAAKFNRVLKSQNLSIIPMFPTKAMIKASVETVSNFDQRVTKWDKHRLRLAAALVAGSDYFEPSVITWGASRETKGE